MGEAKPHLSAGLRLSAMLTEASVPDLLQRVLHSLHLKFPFRWEFGLVCAVCVFSAEDKAFYLLLLSEANSRSRQARLHFGSLLGLPEESSSHGMPKAPVCLSSIRQEHKFNLISGCSCSREAEEVAVGACLYCQGLRRASQDL